MRRWVVVTVLGLLALVLVVCDAYWVGQSNGYSQASHECYDDTSVPSTWDAAFPPWVES